MSAVFVKIPPPALANKARLDAPKLKPKSAVVLSVIQQDSDAEKTRADDAHTHDGAAAETA